MLKYDFNHQRFTKRTNVLLNILDPWEGSIEKFSICKFEEWLR